MKNIIVEREMLKQHYNNATLHIEVEEMFNEEQKKPSYAAVIFEDVVKNCDTIASIASILDFEFLIPIMPIIRDKSRRR
jgi:hypothetical protein